MFATYGGTLEGDGWGLVGLFYIGMVLAAILFTVAFAYVAARFWLRKSPDKSKKNQLRKTVYVLLIYGAITAVVTGIGGLARVYEEHRQRDKEERYWQCYNDHLPPGTKPYSPPNQAAKAACAYLK